MADHQGSRGGRRRPRRRSVRVARKTGVFVVGVALVVVGVALLALPGPGLLVIALGVIVLASEFAWARRLKSRLPHPTWAQIRGALPGRRRRGRNERGRQASPH